MQQHLTMLTSSTRKLLARDRTGFFRAYLLINDFTYFCWSMALFKMAHEITRKLTASWLTMTSSNENIFRVTGPLWGESTGHRWIPFTKTRNVELWRGFYLCLNKRLSKKSRPWWFATPSRSLWRHCNMLIHPVWSSYHQILYPQIIVAWVQHHDIYTLFLGRIDFYPARLNRN